jgi:hypothetical protein
VLTPKNRCLLAADENYFFLKSHYGPEVKYFSGEYIIQIVRHPGAVFTSYQRFLGRIRKRSTTLDQVICGSGPFGSWSQWHQQWDLCAEKLTGQFLRLRYEDVLNDASQACDQIKDLIHLDYNPDNPLPTFEDLHLQNPDYFHMGKSAGWEACYTSEELELLLRHHSTMMEKLGYAVTPRLTH